MPAASATASRPAAKPSTSTAPSAKNPSSSRKQALSAITTHGKRAISLHVVVKHPRASSLEINIVEELGGANHIPVALPQQAVADFVATNNLFAEPAASSVCNDKDDDVESSRTGSPVKTTGVKLESLLVLPYV